MNKLSWSVGLTRMIRKRCNHWINLKTCSGTFLLAHLRWFPFSHFCKCGESAGALWERWDQCCHRDTHRSNLWEIINSGSNESFSIFRKVKNLKLCLDEWQWSVGRLLQAPLTGPVRIVEGTSAAANTDPRSVRCGCPHTSDHVSCFSSSTVTPCACASGLSL